MFNSPISNMQLVRRDPPVVPELKADMTDPSAVDTGHHPLFTEGDVTLASKDGFLFRVHSHTLRTTSGFFRSMFSLPQDVSEPALFSKTGTLYLEEDKDTLDGLLRMMCGLELPTLHTPEQLDALLEAIEKYDTPGPLSIVRLLVIAPTLEIHPLRLYGIARRFGWDAEAKHASSQSLVNNLFDPTLRFYLQRLSTESLLKLLDLHRTRREGRVIHSTLVCSVLMAWQTAAASERPPLRERRCCSLHKLQHGHRLSHLARAQVQDGV